MNDIAHLNTVIIYLPDNSKSILVNFTL